MLFASWRQRHNASTDFPRAITCFKSVVVFNMASPPTPVTPPFVPQKKHMPLCHPYQSTSLEQGTQPDFSCKTSKGVQSPTLSHTPSPFDVILYQRGITLSVTQNTLMSSSTLSIDSHHLTMSRRGLAPTPVEVAHFYMMSCPLREEVVQFFTQYVWVRLV